MKLKVAIQQTKSLDFTEEKYMVGESDGRVSLRLTPKTACRTLFSVQNAAGGFKSTLGQGRGEDRHIPHLFCTKFGPPKRPNLVQRLSAVRFEPFRFEKRKKP